MFLFWDVIFNLPDESLPPSKYTYIDLSELKITRLFCTIYTIGKCLRLWLISWLHTYNVIIHEGCYVWSMFNLPDESLPPSKYTYIYFFNLNLMNKVKISIRRGNVITDKIAVMICTILFSLSSEVVLLQKYFP
jgi:hypothetical protein